MTDANLYLDRDMVFIASPNGGKVLRVGHGSDRKEFLLEDNEYDESFYRWLMNVGKGVSEVLCVQQAEEILNLDKQESQDLVSNLIEVGILRSYATSLNSEEKLRLDWENTGWRDCADFHLASRNLEFIPDTKNGEVYRDIYDQLLEAPDFAGGQPEHYSPKLTRRAVSAIRKTLNKDLSTEEVFERSKPVNKFVGQPASFDLFMSALADAVGIQRIIPGKLGDHEQRSYPSGGARHPLEFYVVSKNHPELPTGAYWFDPLTKELHPRDSKFNSEDVDNACFGKGGVVSSSLFVVVTCRWARHAWKYRYSRSYRMVLLELGHAVQTINLNMRARGIDAYQCPSFSDTRWMELLHLEDYALEGPMYVLGTGLKGRL